MADSASTDGVSAAPLRLVALAHVDRQRPLEDDEDLLLDRVDVPPPDGAGWVAEEVRAGLGQRMRDARGETRVALAPRLPVEYVRMADRVAAHGGKYCRMLRHALREVDTPILSACV